MIKILAKSKSRNLLKFRSKDLARSKKVQSTGTIRQSKFLNSNTKIAFNKLEQTFTKVLIF